LNKNIRNKFVYAENNLNDAKTEYYNILESKRTNPKRLEKDKDKNKLLVRLQAQKKT